MNDRLRMLYVNTRTEYGMSATRQYGQTMTEYALILAAIAIVTYLTYQVMGQDIGSMVNTIDDAMTTS